MAPEAAEALLAGIEEVENKDVESPEDTCNAGPQNGPTSSSSPETAKEQIDMGDSPCASKLYGSLF